MRHLLITTAVLTLLASPVQAADRVQVSFADTEQFADFGDSRWERERNQRSFAEMLQVLGSRLPAGQKMNVKVLDVNLAGELDWWRGRADRIRVLREISWPIVEFEYQVVQDGKTLKAEKVRVSDMAYLQSSSIHDRSSEAHAYERRMLERWAKEQWGK